MAPRQFIINTQNLFVFPKSAVLARCLPLPRFVVLGHTLEAYVLKCLEIRKPTEDHTLNVDGWLEVLNSTFESSLDIDLIQGLWPFTRFHQFHEALIIKLNERQNVWKATHSLVEDYEEKESNQEITTLYSEVIENINHIQRRLGGSKITRSDKAIFRGPYAHTGSDQPYIISVIGNPARGCYNGTLLFTPFLLPIRDIWNNESFGVSIVPGCMTSWLSWSQQSSVMLTNSPYPLNEKCPYILHSEQVPRDFALVKQMAELSIESSDGRCNSMVFEGMPSKAFHYLRDHEYYQVMNQARYHRTLFNLVDEMVVKVNYLRVVMDVSRCEYEDDQEEEHYGLWF
jgi:hypothetical protein